MIRPVLTVLTVLLLPALALAHGAKEPPVTEITGEIIDLACFVAHGARGADNALCAAHHIAPDLPIALLTEEGTIILLWSDHHASHPFDLSRQLVGKKVEMKGVMYEHGDTFGMEVRDVKKVKPETSTTTTR